MSQANTIDPEEPQIKQALSKFKPKELRADEASVADLERRLSEQGTAVADERKARTHHSWEMPRAVKLPTTAQRTHAHITITPRDRPSS